MGLKPLKGSWLKIKRAKQHINNLNERIEVFNQDGYSHYIKHNFDTGENESGVRVYKMPLVEWGLIIGDALHNLRAALDVLACDLIVDGGGTIGNKSQFPFVGKREIARLDSKINERMQGASTEAIDYIKGLEPYESGNKTLWELNALDIIDKHRSIIFNALSISPRVSLQAATYETIFVELPVPEVGTEFSEISRRSTDIPFDEEVNVNLPHPIQIVFHETGVLEGEPIIPSLQNFVSCVEDVVNGSEILFKNSVGIRP